MRKLWALAGAAGLTSIAIAATVWIGVLAIFTDADGVASNTFATANCFPNADTGFLDATSEAADTGGDADGFELNATNAFADGGGLASNRRKSAASVNSSAADRSAAPDTGMALMISTANSAPIS